MFIFSNLMARKGLSIFLKQFYVVLQLFDIRPIQLSYLDEHTKTRYRNDDMQKLLWWRKKLLDR